MRNAVRNHGTARRGQGTAVVGAFQIACSDESERENVEIFHTEFVRELLPKFKFWKQSSFRTSNLGGRYEPGSASIAEDHYALVESQATHKLLLVKVSSHVSVSSDGDDIVYGIMDRYERASVYCGALHGLLAGSRNHPYLAELDARFRSDGLDRLAFLSDPGRVQPHQRALNTAICNTLLQAEQGAGMRGARATHANRVCHRLVCDDQPAEGRHGTHVRGLRG